MNCVVCKHGETRPGQVTVTLQRGETTVNTVTGLVMSRTEAAVKSGAEVEILRFAA